MPRRASLKFATRNTYYREIRAPEEEGPGWKARAEVSVCHALCLTSEDWPYPTAVEKRCPMSCHGPGHLCLSSRAPRPGHLQDTCTVTVHPISNSIQIDPVPWTFLEKRIPGTWNKNFKGPEAKIIL